MKLQIPTAKVFRPLLAPSRYKAAWGGRGSGKSHFFAENMIDRALEGGLHAVCIREVQKTLDKSAKQLIENKLKYFGLGVAQGFEVLKTEIRTPGGGVIIFQGMQDHTADSIKSLEDFDIAWVEEAQTLSAHSLKLLRPTIRAEDSEIWFSWNPTRKVDPVDRLFRDGAQPTNSIVVQANWSDNPWFPAVLKQERLDCLRDEPEEYDHIWEGDYVGVSKGAYYAKRLAEAKLEKRVGVQLAVDPLLSVRIYCDIGGTGARSDAFTMWAAQFVAREIRVLNYYEAQGQELADHLGWLEAQGYGPEERVKIVLPHDGATNDKVHRVSYESAFIDAGYEVEVIPNQGKGAASARIEEGRRLFPMMWFDQKTVEAGGVATLAWYHEKIDEIRGIGLGPEHDWSSHGADGFGLMCVAYEPPQPKGRPIRYAGWSG